MVEKSHLPTGVEGDLRPTSDLHGHNSRELQKEQREKGTRSERTSIRADRIIEPDRCEIGDRPGRNRRKRGWGTPPWWARAAAPRCPAPRWRHAPVPPGSSSCRRDRRSSTTRRTSRRSATCAIERETQIRRLKKKTPPQRSRNARAGRTGGRWR